jgi:release factor glutamine methyltransferase
MIEAVAGLDAAALHTAADEPATPRAAGALETLVGRRRAGEPLQYVLGSWTFRGIDLLVDRRVLIPRPETEVLAEVAIAEAARLGLRVGRPDPWATTTPDAVVCDLGTGSGAVALALAAALPDVQVWATDVSAGALAVARANLAGSGGAAVRVRLATGSWFAALPPALAGRVHLVVSNPPYVREDEFAALPPEVRDWEPAEALVSGPTGMEAVAEILADAPRWLTRPGTVVLEVATERAEVAAALARQLAYARVELHPDLAGRPRILVAAPGP